MTPKTVMALSLIALSIPLFTVMSAYAEDSGKGLDGAEIISRFKVELQTALRSGLKEGPLHAMSVCKMTAPGIAQKLSVNGIRVGRTSDRLRNPNNVAPDWVQPILNDFLENKTDRWAKEVLLPDARIGYVEPITVQPLCTTCHGDVLADEVSEQLQLLYPQDRATGYRIGEFRGLFWVEYPVSGVRSAE
ncbi:DUF3365 domain-containing protein [Aestuariicella hydrocarbonica]|uniref:DUF3365 domain-containing protein n=1 Tax=Pseudomaricurvus hydrocarbonicus TaxID=1470433 RepID=A0A9E5MP46_9GAMM|nr:DUF3365 domain-containing protein [Aestuariicella hydrocarbonica]NHO67810.1 DUF3365 domain-containing protein [Aestuariicella hydrocarbonica]